MLNRLFTFLGRLSEEPPFRLFTKLLVKAFPVSVRTKARWDVASRPQYLAGVLAAANEALEEGVEEISVFEFGVAGGNGLLALEEIAGWVEAETKVRIAVYGFDAGSGLPDLIGDYRDCPDRWQEGDYPMDEKALRARLGSRTALVLGNIKDTLPKYLPQITQPIGFVAVDVDIYSSTCDVLRIFLLPGKKMLRRVFMYFDDVDLMFTHRFAGELLAIDEFNASSSGVKIDNWRSVAKQRPFPEAAWLNRMYIAHDLEAISRMRPRRDRKIITVDDSQGNTA